MKFLKWLGFDPEKHSVRTEILAGLTTFLTMAYILAVNPNVFDAQGGVMTDLQGRRAIVMGMDAEGKYTTLKAKAPLAEMNRYCTALSSLTSGRGTFTMTFSSYELVPADVQQALLKAYEEAAAEEE